MDAIETVLSYSNEFSPLSYLLGRVHENLINIDDCLAKEDINKALMETHSAIKEIKEFVNNTKVKFNLDDCSESLDESKL